MASDVRKPNVSVLVIGGKDAGAGIASFVTELVRHAFITAMHIHDTYTHHSAFTYEELCRIAQHKERLLNPAPAAVIVVSLLPDPVTFTPPNDVKANVYVGSFITTHLQEFRKQGGKVFAFSNQPGHCMALGANLAKEHAFDNDGEHVHDITHHETLSAELATCSPATRAGAGSANPVVEGRVRNNA